jgi:D-tyrosyl-tRNA(Tyr) deacylase
MRRLYVLSAISLNSAFSHRMSTSLRMSYVPSSYNTLFVATTTDTASMNIASALRDSSSTWNSNLSNEKSSIFWTKSDAPSSELSSSGESESRIVWLWIQDQQLLHMNSPDRLLNQELSCAPSPERSLDDVKFDEVIFLSKHCAASGKASLTVHPIGEDN